VAELKRSSTEMSISPDNTVETWRDLTDELTPEQIARLEQSERQYRHNALEPNPWWSTAPRSDCAIAEVLLHSREPMRRTTSRA
jgi:hypothetical protein